MMDFVSKKNLTEFGNLMLVEKRTDIEGGDVALRLPGVRQGDMADRNIKPEVNIVSTICGYNLYKKLLLLPYFRLGCFLLNFHQLVKVFQWQQLKV